MLHKKDREHAYTDKYNEFTKETVKSIVSNNEGDNVVLSPFSILMLLLLAAESTGGTTRDEIVKVLGPKMSYDRFCEMMREINDAITKDPVLKNANAACVKPELGVTIHHTYIKSIKKHLSAELFASDDIISAINSWVKEKTNGMIPEIADASMENALAFLINAVAFEAEWQEPYRDYNIQEGVFNNADGSKSLVPMLNSEEERYIKTQSLTGFVKPYKGGGFSFIALLPKRRGNAALVETLKDISFTKLYAKSVPKTVLVTMPEYKCDFGSDLTSLFKEMGVAEVFSAHADFSPMSDEWLKIDQILHKAHIEVDREGTKAAAATAAMVATGCFMPPSIPEVILDRPFIYAIMHDETQLPVFVGTANQL